MTEVAKMERQVTMAHQPSPPGSRLGRAEEGGKQVLVLPEIKSPVPLSDRRKPPVPGGGGDFLPPELMIALAVPGQHREALGPPSRYRNLHTTVAPGRKKPSNVFNHSHARSRFSHLLNETTCACGAGKDISFLYDVPVKDTRLARPEGGDKSKARYDAAEPAPKEYTGSGMHLPDSLVPEEYHAVKNKGVMGLEYYEDEYTTQPVDHEKHLVMFPSTNPASRYEVVQLKKTLDDMLEKEGITDIHETSLAGPTQMHNLIELIKKEQNIYNVVFHEIIRQSTVECVERGALLAELRQKYSDLLSRVPIQIKGLHEEVLAQRALDRRLTEELVRFKSTISHLTQELTEVKEHDRDVTAQALQAQEDLKNALHESHKNASLLAEYHDLYELQRRRLDQQVGVLAEEKEIWATAAYSLALKVTDECKLNTAKRLHMAEKAWHKLASHFTILLSDRDTEQMTKLSAHVEKWRDLMDELKMTMRRRDEETRTRLNELRASMDRWIGRFQKDVFNKEGQIAKGPGPELVREIAQTMKTWAAMVQQEQEKYGGDDLLQLQDLSQAISAEMTAWTDYGLQVFKRHKLEDGRNYPDLDGMNNLNEKIEELLKQFSNRFTGENGVATGIIHLSSSLENWLAKITSSLTSHKPLSELEWLRFYQSLEDWLGMVDLSYRLVGETQLEEERSKNFAHTRIDISEVYRLSQRWISSATNGIDSEDAKLIEQVSTYHKNLVQWLVQLLLRLAPDLTTTSIEAREGALFGSASVGRLTADARTLCLQLDNFTRYVMMCCEGIVRERMEVRKENMDENAEGEMRELARFEHECDEWKETGRLLLCELTGEEIGPLLPPREDPEKKRRKDRYTFTDAERLQALQVGEEKPAEPSEVKDEKQATEAEKPAEEGEGEKKEGDDATETDAAAAQPTSGEQKPKPSDGDESGFETGREATEIIETIGRDGNTTTRAVPKISFEDVKLARASADSATNGPVPVQTERADHQRSYEALAAVGELQDRLLTTEMRAQESEERAATAEGEMLSMEEKIRALERQLRETEGEVTKLQATQTEGRPEKTGLTSSTAPSVQ